MGLDDFLIKYISLKMHSSWALVFGFIISVIAFSGIDGFFEKIVPDVITRFLIYGVILLFWTLYWSHNKFCLPKNKKGRVGLVIAIFAEDNHEEKRLKADLIFNLKKSILDQGLGDIINVVVLKNHFSENIRNVKYFNRIRKIIKGHFYLFGEVKRRKDGESKYFLNLDGLVVHTPIDIRASSTLSQEFLTVLPKEISFFESIEFRGFKVTADIIYLAVRYITGVAAYLSGDPYLAIKLHTNLKEEFNKFRPLPAHLQKIRDRVPLLLSDEELAIARNFYRKEDFPNMENQVKRAIEINPNSYGGWLLKAIVDFLYRGDPAEAMESIKKAKRYVRGTGEWRYSQAFLQLWLGRYPDAIKTLDKIVSCSYSHENITACEVEDFNLKLLKQGKFKGQLYFWLGFLNYKKKNNLPQSLEYFEKFENECTADMILLKQKSTPWLRDIRRDMGINPKSIGTS